MSGVLLFPRGIHERERSTVRSGVEAIWLAKSKSGPAAYVPLTPREGRIILWSGAAFFASLAMFLAYRA